MSLISKIPSNSPFRTPKIKSPEITAVITAHREGYLIPAPVASMMAAIEKAEAYGLKVESVAYLDNPDSITREVYSRLPPRFEIREVMFKDQGKVRNHAAQAAAGKYIAFLDADDHWSINWLTNAYKMMQKHDPDNTILHPEFNWFFDGSNGLHVQIDDDDEDFSNDLLRIVNYWDALSFASKNIHLKFPYADRDVAAGYAFEDWQWNCETIQAGLRHRIVKDTIIFKRRRNNSQTMKASRNKTMPRTVDFFRYDSFNKI